MNKIILNSIQCKHCKKVLVSEHVHDFKTCACGKVSVDGGNEYLKRVGDMDDMLELSIAEDEEDNIVNHAVKSILEHIQDLAENGKLKNNWEVSALCEQLLNNEG